MLHGDYYNALGCVKVEYGGYIYICHGQKSRFFGDGHTTFNRNPYNGYIKPYCWVEFPIPYYMEIMGV